MNSSKHCTAGIEFVRLTLVSGEYKVDIVNALRNLFQLDHRGFFCFLVIGLMFTGGCQRVDQGPKRYPVSGTITLAGKPVVRGMIRFEPDSSKGNSGPESSATIVDGKYVTDAEKGAVAGPTKVTVLAYDGNVPQVLGDNASRFGIFLLKAPHEETCEIPSGKFQYDVDIPASALAKSPAK